MASMGSKRSVHAKKRARRRVFLSYAHQDAEFVRSIASFLSELGEDFGYTVWTDEELAAGSNWALEVGRALERSDAMVVLLSPAWSHSPWLRRELEYALTTKKLEGAVIPVLLRPIKDIP